MRARGWMALAAAALIAGCASDGEQRYPEREPGGRWIVPGSVADQQRQRQEQAEGGISLFDFGGGADVNPEGVIGVNRHLWRASLDVLSVLPLASADAYGGVVITDWSASPDDSDERAKVTALLSGIDLSTDAIRVVVHVQRRGDGGDWVAAEAAADTARRIEDSILARARQLRLAEAG